MRILYALLQITSYPLEKMSQLEPMSLSEKESADSNEESVPMTQMKNENQELDHSHKHQYEQFLKELESQSEPEAKIQFTINFMESSLSQTGTPHFKSFWEARNLCLQLFKEPISPASRVGLWAKYNELSSEARRLKEILDEQSAFAVEQIEIAVKALEDDINHFDEQLVKMPPVDFAVPCKIIQDKLNLYQELQKQLNLLNTQASRITAMRKELIRTDMRVRQKNRFFQRLSSIGDKVFPRRKELIKQVSQEFIQDVDSFIQDNFNGPEMHESFFILREEIKGFQNIAKILTLNTHSFTHTRMRLSECWDKIKNSEKERKKERSQQKNIHRQNLEDILQKVKGFIESFKEGAVSVFDAQKQIDDLSNYARSMELGREEIQMVREEMGVARKLVKDKMLVEEDERRQHEQEKEHQRRHKIQEIKDQISALLKSTDSSDADQLGAERDEILKKLNETSMHKSEKQELERLLKPLRDIISEKKENSLLHLSEGDRQSMQQYREILKQRKERRNEIKETIRKSSGSSGLDFKQAMAQNAQLEAEKERLEKINHGIKEIEQKIAELENKNGSY